MEKHQAAVEDRENDPLVANRLREQLGEILCRWDRRMATDRVQLDSTVAEEARSGSL